MRIDVVDRFGPCGDGAGGSARYSFATEAIEHHTRRRAPVLELAYRDDSKSSALVACGFESHRGYQREAVRRTMIGIARRHLGMSACVSSLRRLAAHGRHD